MLGRDPEKISIKEILDCVRHFGEAKRIPSTGKNEESKIDETLSEIDQSVAETLDGKSLQDLIRR